MKFKIPDRNYIKICLDRLTRFKPVGVKYKRVFDDILNKFLIGGNIPETSLDERILAVSTILNEAISKNIDLTINEIIKKEEEDIFYLKDDDYFYLNSKINFKGALELFSEDELPLNLRRFKFYENFGTLTREKFSTLYPITKVILVEGITEEILLIEFAKILGLDFKKKGFFVLGAGGKNQVARKYYQLINEIKIPIFILLDFDAFETVDFILPKLRKIDTLYKIKTGEFEDILPKSLIKNALNFHFQENLATGKSEIGEGKTVSELNNCYKNNGWGDFKKADFAKIIREYILTIKNPPLSFELETIINKIKEN